MMAQERLFLTRQFLPPQLMAILGSLLFWGLTVLSLPSLAESVSKQQPLTKRFSCANPVVSQAASSTQSNTSVTETITWKQLDTSSNASKTQIDQAFNQLLESKFTQLSDSSSITQALAGNLFDQLEQQIKTEQRQKNRRILAQTDKVWPPGSHLKIAFDFSGTEPSNFAHFCDNLIANDCQEKIKTFILDIAGRWSEHGNISFGLSNVWEYADIRISFSAPGAWSKIGTDARTVNPNFATMNFHYSSWHYPPILSSTILHEFGHAIGLRHEHKSPNTPFKVDEQAAYQLYQQELGWNQEQVKNNVILRLNETETPLFVGEFDNRSIMIYPFPRQIIKNDSQCPSNDEYFCVEPTYDLSDYDKASIKQLYYFTQSVVTVVKKETNARNQVVWEIDFPALEYEGSFYKVRMVNRDNNNSQFLLLSAQQIDKPSGTDVPVFENNQIHISRVELRINGQPSSFFKATLELQSKNGSELIFAVTGLTEIAENS